MISEQWQSLCCSKWDEPRIPALLLPFLPAHAQAAPGVVGVTGAQDWSSTWRWCNDSPERFKVSLVSLLLMFILFGPLLFSLHLTNLFLFLLFLYVLFDLIPLALPACYFYKHSFIWSHKGYIHGQILCSLSMTCHDFTCVTEDSQNMRLHSFSMLLCFIQLLLGKAWEV